jgi:hypothetical protein
LFQASKLIAGCDYSLFKVNLDNPIGQFLVFKMKVDIFAGGYHAHVGG